MGILYAYTYAFYLPIATLSLYFIKPNYLLMVFFILGGMMAFVHQYLVLPTGTPQIATIPHAVIEGTVASIPISSHSKTQFTFAIDTLNGKSANALVQLAWYNNAPILHAGERWQLSAKLKKPRNFLNPGSYDFVSSLNTKHIYWTGYIRSFNNKRLSGSPASFDWLRLREHLSKAISHLAPDTQTAGIIEALTLNITTHISQNDWDLFRRTGTTHLFGISGEHIALLSGLFFFIIRWLWSKSTSCCLLIPAHSVASCGGLIIAVLYAFLAGFAPPVQRALIGCFFYTLGFLGKQRFTPWQVWRYALLGVLCIEPHAVFMQGFYFSFLAVACLLLTQQRWRLNGYKGNLALQLSCLIGLMPLSLYWFSYGSINGFIANLFAIPLVGFLIVPLSLITMLVSSFSFAGVLMKPLSWLISLLFKGLIEIEHLAEINITWSLNSIELVMSFLGALLLWVLLPVKPFNYLALLWCLLPFFPARTELQSGEVLIDVLDVGQGLAVSIQTKDHVLLYDTGDQFFQGSDLGKMVVLPFYQARGIKTVDAIIISHPDKDHRGGLKSIEKNIPVQRLLVNDPLYYHRGFNCHHYPEWDWDKVHFRFLSIATSFNNKNNNSCILQISTKKSSVLLTGDIESLAEDYLIKTYGKQLKSEVLIIPHHASKTSSSYRFLLEVAPQYAIASLGFDNRFRFPHPKTEARLRLLNIPFYRTDQCGMTEVKLFASGIVPKPQCFSRA